MNISREQAEELSYCNVDGLERLEKTITDTSRWSIWYRIVFKDSTGGLWAFDYERGATECQEVEPLPEVVECYAVEPVQVTAYKAVK